MWVEVDTHITQPQFLELSLLKLNELIKDNILTFVYKAHIFIYLFFTKHIQKRFVRRKRKNNFKRTNI